MPIPEPKLPLAQEQFHQCVLRSWLRAAHHKSCNSALCLDFDIVEQWPIMSRGSPSPDLGDSSDDEVANEGSKVQNSEAAPRIWSWLHIAASTGNVEKVKECIDGSWRYPPNGCKSVTNVDQLDCKSWTPLMVAALAGYADVVDYLVVQKNADFRLINPTGAQCIHLAAKSGSLETLQLIISYGADTNARTDPPLLQSPLHFAAANPTFEACQMLLEHGANIMAQDAAGCTAVHLAAKYGRMDTIRFLADKRADILLVNDFKGISPDLYSNSKYKSNQIRKIIEEYTNTSQAEVEVADGGAGSSWGFSYSNPRRSKFLR